MLQFSYVKGDGIKEENTVRYGITGYKGAHLWLCMFVHT